MEKSKSPTLEERRQWCLNNLIGRYKPNDFEVYIDNGKLVIDGSVIIYDNFLELPDEALIDIVKGDVFISNTIEFRKGALKSLKNMPRIITGHFICGNNPEITTLEGGPEQVGGTFAINHCSLKDLKGCPKVLGILKVYSNKLENIDDIMLSDFCSIDLEFNESLDKQSPLIQKLYLSNKILS